MKGRPEINPLRVKQYIELEKDKFAALQRIIKKTGINVQREIEKREGYHGGADSNTETVVGVSFVCGKTTRRVRRCDERDLVRVKKAIYEAKLQANYVIVSLHSREIGETEKEELADFAEEFARFCIDNGANAIVGHGRICFARLKYIKTVLFSILWEILYSSFIISNTHPRISSSNTVWIAELQFKSF